MVRRYLSGQYLILGFTLLILFFVCAFPFFKLASAILFSGVNGEFSLNSFKELFESPATLRAMGTTVTVAGGVSLLSLLLAVPLAWLLSRTDLPARSRLRTWLCLPYAIPPYIGAIAWIALANPNTGFLNHLFGEGTLNIYSMFGLIWVETSFLYTFVLLTCLASLDRMDSSFEEAARLSGAGPIRLFIDITLPLIRPALLSGMLLVFLATAASFGVPALIGSPARIYLMTTQIYTFQKMGSLSGLYKAGALSMILLIAAAVTLFLNHRLVSRSQFQTVGGKSARPSLIELGRWRWWLYGLIVVVLILVLGLPIFGIAASALSKVQGSLDPGNLTFDNFTRVFLETVETPRAVWNSILLSVIAATIACFIGIFAGYLQQKTRLPGRNGIEILSSLPYATPGTVVAFALILAFSQGLWGIFPSLYNTLGMLALAYVVKYLSFSIKTMSDGYRQIDNVLAEAARVSGAGWTTTMRTIWIPLLKPSLVAAWFLVFMPVMSELTMTILLTGPGLETIGTLIFQLQEYSDASGGSSSVLALVVVLSVMLINTAVKKLSGGRYGL